MIGIKSNRPFKDNYMLEHLYIRNYALIKELDISFGNGFSVITGETGAGKSILLGAINMILGQRADMKVLQDSKEKCVVEATFRLSDFNLRELFEACELDYYDECIIRREISPAGKSRAFVNDTPVQLSQLREIGMKLIDIHSQHQNLLINNASFVVGFVDTIAGNSALLSDYRKAFAAYNLAKKEYDEFVSTSVRAKEEEEYLRFQLGQIEEARLAEGEQEELEEESRILSHSEDIKNGLYSISGMFDSEQGGVISSLRHQMQTARSLSNVYPQADTIAQRIETAYLDLKDLSYEVSNLAEDITFDPERFNYVNERLNRIYTLEQRFHTSSVSGLLDMAYGMREKLDTIDRHDDMLESLERKVSKSYAEAEALAGKLSEARRSHFDNISEGIENVLKNLGMPDVSISIQSVDKEQLSADGKDSVKMMFSANRNRGMQDISEIASGGEIARVMLAIKYMICRVKVLPTIFFDEIDTGVSGEIAARMGDIMKDMGSHMQVISITHLPQIAAKGNCQYKVYKDTGADDVTTSNIRLLDNEERINELAMMLSGSSISEAAINNAKELLKND